MLFKRRLCSSMEMNIFASYNNFSLLQVFSLSSKSDTSETNNTVQACRI